MKHGAAVTDVLSHKWNKQSHKTLEKTPTWLFHGQTHWRKWRTAERQERRWQWFLPSVWSEQQVCDWRQQFGQVWLDVSRLSDGVAAEIEPLQVGAGGQRLKICQCGDFCACELMKTHTKCCGGWYQWQWIEIWLTYSQNKCESKIHMTNVTLMRELISFN